MHVLKKALVVAALALSGVVAPTATTPAIASDCTGSVSPTGATPTSTDVGAAFATATFATYGPGYIPQHCDLGWVTTCELYQDGIPVPAGCTTGYTPQPDRCPSTGLCEVYVQGAVVVPPATTVSVRAVLGMTWGCCGYQGGPETRSEITWSIRGSAPECGDVGGDLCKKVRGEVMVLIDDLLP